MRRRMDIGLSVCSASRVFVDETGQRIPPEAVRPALNETPRIIHTEIPAGEWASMGELEITR